MLIVAIVLVLSPNRPDYASNIVTKMHVVDWPQAMVTGPGAGFDDAVAPPHDGAVERSTDHG